MRHDTATLAVATAALVISLVGGGVLLHFVSDNRQVVKDARRGLVCLLQRAVLTIENDPSITSAQRARLVPYYNREIRLLGGPRSDCNLTTPPTEEGGN